MVGIAALVIIIGTLYGVNHRFTNPTYTGSMATTSLSLTSPAFDAGESIPSKYTCEGAQTSPPLAISGVPAETKTLALLMDDPDVPKKVKPDGMFDHWVLFNIPATTTEIAEGSNAGIVGENGGGISEYTGPCPPKEYEPSEHRYFFKLYALDTALPLSARASKTDVERAMKGHVIAETQLVAKYKKE